MHPDRTAPETAFRQARKVMFKDCDPAGLVFFPRFFEMMNDCVEGFFDHVGHPFEALHGRGAVPTVDIQAGFPAPSRHGDRLRLSLWVEAVGRSSAALRILTEAEPGGEARMHYRAVLVLVGADGRPMEWPAAVRRAMTGYQESEGT